MGRLIDENSVYNAIQITTDNLLRAIIVLIQAAVKYELVEFSIRK